MPTCSWEGGHGVWVRCRTWELCRPRPRWMLQHSSQTSTPLFTEPQHGPGKHTHTHKIRLNITTKAPSPHTNTIKTKIVMHPVHQPVLRAFPIIPYINPRHFIQYDMLRLVWLHKTDGYLRQKLKVCWLVRVDV